MEGGSIFTFHLFIIIIIIIIVIVIIITSKLVIKFTKISLNIITMIIIIIITMVNDLGDGGQQPRSGRV